jgi:hypothetical protein
MRQASAAMTSADVTEFERLGIPRINIEHFQLIGLARVARIADTDLYEPDPSGCLMCISPVLAQDPATPESRRPESYVRIGKIVDLVAWDPEYPRQWVLRTGFADWLGCIRPQFLDPPPVWVRQSVLSWFRANCEGIVVLSRDPATIYSLLMEFHGGIWVEDEVHAAQLRRILDRPWPLPPISIGPMGGPYLDPG